MILLPLLLAAEARAETPLMVLHLDPGVAVAPTAGLEGGLTAKLEFPIAYFVFFTAPAMIGMVTGERSPDEVLTPAPPISPEYTLFVSRGLGAEDPVAWGGGLGLRVRPLVGARAIVPPARGLWMDVNGRYGTRDWGLDGAVGWDIPLSPVVALGPVVGAVWEDHAVRLVASLSLSLSLNGERVGGEVAIPAP